MIRSVEIRISDETRERVDGLLRQGRLAGGPAVLEFEKEFAAFCGVEHAVACVNGTQALQTIWETLGLRRGQKVLTTPFTFIASSNSVVFSGGVPVFADICPRTFNLDPNRVEDALRKDPEIKTLLLVNLFGLPCDADAFDFLAEKYGLLVVEDCAQSHAAEFRGRKCGSLYRASSFSFYATKNLSCGEGGMALFNDDQDAATARKVVNHGRKGGYVHDRVGYNFRMSDIHATIGLGSLGELEENTRRRIANAEFLSANLPKEITPPAVPEGRRHVFHQYAIRAPDRDALGRHLKNRGVETSVVYPLPNHRQEAYEELFPELKRAAFPEAEKACGEVLSLPVHPYLRREDLKRICEAASEFYANPGETRNA